jgi:hypothetical protein
LGRRGGRHPRLREAGLGLQADAVPLRHVGERGAHDGLEVQILEQQRGPRLVRHRVDAHLHQPLLQVRVPVVLDLVVRPPRQMRRDRRPPAQNRQTQKNYSLNPSIHLPHPHKKFPSEKITDQRKAWEVCVPVAKKPVEMDDDLLLLERESAALDVWAQVIRPPQPTALAAPQETCKRKKTHEEKFSDFAFSTAFHGSTRFLGFNSGDWWERGVTGLLGEGAPAAMAVALDVGHELLVFVRRPRSFLQPQFVTTRSSPHDCWARQKRALSPKRPSIVQPDLQESSLCWESLLTAAPTRFDCINEQGPVRSTKKPPSRFLASASEGMPPSTPTKSAETFQLNCLHHSRNFR